MRGSSELKTAGGGTRTPKINHPTTSEEPVTNFSHTPMLAI